MAATFVKVTAKYQIAVYKIARIKRQKGRSPAGGYPGCFVQIDPKISNLR